MDGVPDCRYCRRCRRRHLPRQMDEMAYLATDLSTYEQ